MINFLCAISGMHASFSGHIVTIGMSTQNSWLSGKTGEGCLNFFFFFFETYHKGVAVTVDVRRRQVQATRIHSAQLTETLATQESGFGRRVLAALEQHRHQAGDDRFHRLTGAHLPRQALLRSPQTPTFWNQQKEDQLSLPICQKLMFLRSPGCCASCLWGWWAHGCGRRRSRAGRLSWRAVVRTPGHCCLLSTKQMNKNTVRCEYAWLCWYAVAGKCMWSLWRVLGWYINTFAFISFTTVCFDFSMFKRGVNV